MTMAAQLDREKIILNKVKELPPYYLQELLDFIEYLQLKAKRRETLFLSEIALAKDWLLHEEDEAWKDLQKET